MGRRRYSLFAALAAIPPAIREMYCEAYLSALQACPEAPAWFPLSAFHGGWPQGAGQSPLQGPQAPFRLNACAPDLAMERLEQGAAPLLGAGLPLKRLKKRREFLRAAAKGKRAAKPGLVLQALAVPGPELRLGFTVTKKVGNAVIRNRARRRLKEAARLTLPGMAVTGWDLVLIGRDGTAKRPFALLMDDLRASLRQAGVLG